MFLKTDAFHGNNRIWIAVRPEQVKRMSNTCFRGIDHRLAGNFCRWASSEDLFAEEQMLAWFLEDIQRNLNALEMTHSMEIDTGTTVGWSSTDDQNKYLAEELEDYQPNRKSTALRVKRETGILAPTTTLVTIVYFMKREPDGIVVNIGSIYPGKDIGRLKDDITKCKQCVFFDWNHPGAPF